MKIIHKKWIYLLASVLISMFVTFPAVAQKSESSSDIVAVVNGDAIRRVEFDSEMAMVKKRFVEQGKSLTEDQIDKIGKSLLETLINRALLFQESKELGISIKEEAITNQLQKIKQRYPSETEFENTIKKFNLTLDDIKSQVNRALAINEFITKKVASNIVVSETESKTYYDTHSDSFKKPEQVKASHILIKVVPQADESQKKKAREQIQAVQEKIKNGGDFAALAKEFSQGPSSTKGGDLGYFGRGQMVKPFEDAAFALEPTAVSDIIETRFGYHLIKVFDKKPEGTLQYQEVKPKLAQYLKQEKTKQEVERYVDKLRDKAVIERLL